MNRFIQDKSLPVRTLIAFAIIAVVGGIIFSVVSIAQAAWYDDGWSYRQKVTIDSAQVNSDLSDFPVYVDLADMSSSFFSNVQSDGSDIRVTTADGATEVAREVVTLDTASSTGELHFKAPNISSSSDTEFYIYYGNSNASGYAETDTYGAQNVWTNGFKGVWHMEEDPSGTAPQAIDSTDVSSDLESHGSMTSDDSVSGKIGQAINFDGSDDYLDVQNSPPPDGASEITISAFFEADATGTDLALLGTVDGTDTDDGTGMRYDQSGAVGGGNDLIKFGVINESGTVSNGESESNLQTTNNQHLALTWSSGNSPSLYADGSEVSYTAAPSSLSGNVDIPEFYVGRGMKDNAGFWDGEIDEVRIMNSKRSADWISAEEINQDAPTTFYTVSSEETAGTEIESVSDTPDPAEIGEDVTFSVDWLDADGDGVKTYVCKTDSVTAGSGCDGGTWAAQDSSFSQTDPQEVSYTTQSGDAGSNDYYAFVCDSSGNCSPSESGTFDVVDIVTNTIKADGSGDYQTISGWESATDNDLVANGKRYIGQIADTSTYDELVTLDASSTDSTFYRKLTVATTSRHDGTAGTGPVVNPSSNGHVFTVNEDNFRAEWLEITGWSGASQEGFRVNNTGFTLDHSILHDAESGDAQADGVFVGSNDITVNVNNSVFYDIGRVAIHIQDKQNSAVNIRNVTAYNVGTGDITAAYPAIGFDIENSRDNSGSVMNVKNTTADHAKSDRDAFHGGEQGGSFGDSDYNASNDDTAPGSNSLTNVTQSDQFQNLTDGSENLHLQSGANLIDAGTSLSSSYEVDIDGGTRTSTWDIGADERIGPTITTTSESPDPVTAGNSITFSINWDHNENNSVKTYACKTDSVTAGSGCDGGTWASSSTSFAETDPQESSYTTTEDDVGNQTYYAFACDADGICSAGTTATFEVDQQITDATSSSDVGGGTTIQGGGTIR